MLLLDAPDLGFGLYLPSVWGIVVEVADCVGAMVDKAHVVNLVAWECASPLIPHVYTYKFCCCTAQVTEAVGCVDGKPIYVSDINYIKYVLFQVEPD